MENGVLTVTVQKEVKMPDEGGDGLNLVPLVFIKSFAPSKNGAGAGVVVGRMPEDGVGPAFTHAFDQGLKALHEDFLVERHGGRLELCGNRGLRVV
ncbi:hypothetical protein ACFXTI_014315 [Malus domestica]